MMLKKICNICNICGENNALKSCFPMSKHSQNNSTDITEKIRIVLQIQDAVEILHSRKICLNCFQMISSLFDSLTEMKQVYLTTQSILKAFLEEQTEKNWLEFRKFHNARNCKVNHLSKTETNDAVSTKVKYVNDSVLEKDNETDYLNEYTEPEWLLDVEQLPNTLKVKMESDPDINHFTLKKMNVDGKISNLKNTLATDKIKRKNPTRINKRGLAFTSTSDVYVFLNDGGSYECDLCGISFKWRHTAEHHVRSQHTKEKPFKCPMCEKGFTASHYLNRHVSCVHEKENFSCEKCGQKFPRRYILAAHERTHEGPPSLSCPHVECSKKFYAVHILKAHLVNSHSAKDLICDKCGKKFRTTARLMNHRQRHEEKSLKCPYCPKLFSVKTDLFVHIKYHKEALPWRCGACNMFFKTTRGLQNHFAISHGERVSRLDLYMLFNSSQKN